MSRSVIAAGFVIAMVSFVACTGAEEAIIAALGGECVLSSDCEEGLVCVFETCHQECATSTDCSPTPDGDAPRCMAGPAEVHYCQLPGELQGCGYNSECPGAQICAIDGECRDECHSEKDCVSDQLCVSSSCADSSELDPEGGLVVTSAEGPGAGSPCTYDSECSGFDESFVCKDGRCNFECIADVDCESLSCIVPDSSEGGRCAVSEFACVPGYQGECNCLSGSLGVQVCNAEGSGFGPCEDGTPTCGAP
jgi:hypothetical protein